MRQLHSEYKCNYEINFPYDQGFFRKSAVSKKLFQPTFVVQSPTIKFNFWICFKNKLVRRKLTNKYSHSLIRDLNSGPLVYKTSALITELMRQLLSRWNSEYYKTMRLFYHFIRNFSWNKIFSKNWIPLTLTCHKITIVRLWIYCKNNLRKTKWMRTYSHSLIRDLNSGPLVY